MIVGHCRESIEEENLFGQALTQAEESSETRRLTTYRQRASEIKTGAVSRAIRWAMFALGVLTLVASDPYHFPYMPEMDIRHRREVVMDAPSPPKNDTEEEFDLSLERSSSH